MKRVLAALAIVLAPTLATAMDVSSASIQNGVLDKINACEDLGGEDVSPQISISNPPQGTTHFSIVFDDPDAKALDGKTWVHWNVVNIKASNTDFKAGKTPPGVVLENDNEDDAYGGMCPTDGRHTYRLTVFALKSPIDEDGPSALTVESFLDEYEDQVLAVGQVKGAFP